MAFFIQLYSRGSYLPSNGMKSRQNLAHHQSSFATRSKINLSTNAARGSTQVPGSSHLISSTSLAISSHLISSTSLASLLPSFNCCIDPKEGAEHIETSADQPRHQHRFLPAFRLVIPRLTRVP